MVYLFVYYGQLLIVEWLGPGYGDLCITRDSDLRKNKMTNVAPAIISYNLK
jgi:hypothetical protein